MRRFFLAVGLLSVSLPWAKGPANLELTRTKIDLPGPPSMTLPWDHDGDGKDELLLVLAFRDVDSVSRTRIEQAVEVTSVVPKLFDRRELWLVETGAEGGSASRLAELPLTVSALAIDPGERIIALDGDGVLRLESEPVAGFRFRRIVQEPTILAGGRTFFPRLSWTTDLDGDGADDLLLPGRDGPAVYLWQGSEFASKPVTRIASRDHYESAARRETRARRTLSWPRVGDIDGDEIPDLMFRNDADRVHVFLGDGDGRFRPLYGGSDCRQASSALRMLRADDDPTTSLPDLRAIDDVDGDGRAEALFVIEDDEEKDGLRANLEQAKRPVQTLRFHPLDENLSVAAEPRWEFDVTGHIAQGDAGHAGEGWFVDLDDDGVKELISVTLDFSMWQAARVLVTKKMSIGLDFHIWRLADDRFLPVPDLDLSEKLKFNFRDVRLTRVAQFAGDFDGDGRSDFVHLGRGTKVTIHRGQPGAVYPKKPDLVVELDQPVEDLALVVVRDLDGDGRSDLAITSHGEPEKEGESKPVYLALYLSGDAS